MTLAPRRIVVQEIRGTVTGRACQIMAQRKTTARPNRMVSTDPIKDYMRQHGCGFPEALEALAAQLGPPTAQGVRRALQTLGRAGAPVDLLEALEVWSADQMQQAA